MNTHRTKPTALAAEIMPADMTDTQLIRHIATLAGNADGYVRSAAQAAYDCGLALLVAKDRCPHGEWGHWLEDHWDHSPRLAQTYMQLAKAQTSADFDLRTRSIASAMRSITSETMVEQTVEIHVRPSADSPATAAPVQPAPSRSAVPDLPPVVGGAGLNSTQADPASSVPSVPAFSPDAASRLREPVTSIPGDDVEWEDVQDDDDPDPADPPTLADIDRVFGPPTDRQDNPAPSSDLSTINQWLEDFDAIHNRLLALTKLVARLPEDVRAQLEAML
jgi:hypothetical protein